MTDADTADWFDAHKEWELMADIDAEYDQPENHWIFPMSTTEEQTPPRPNGAHQLNIEMMKAAHAADALARVHAALEKGGDHGAENPHMTAVKVMSDIVISAHITVLAMDSRIHVKDSWHQKRLNALRAEQSHRNGLRRGKEMLP